MTEDTNEKRVIHIPRGATLLNWELGRRAPENGQGEAIDIQFTIHPDLQYWLQRMAKDGATAHGQTLTTHLTDISEDAPQYIRVLDGHGDEAWNMNLSSTISRADTPNLRLDYNWVQSLGFLRLCVHSLTRKLRITMANRAEAQGLWTPTYCHVRHKEVPAVDAGLLKSVEKLRTTHITWPKIVKTTVILATT